LKIIFIDGSLYNSIKTSMKIETIKEIKKFNSYKEKKSKEKMNINNIISANSIKLSKNDNDVYALVLDGKNINTTKALVNNNLSSSNILILERDAKTFSIISREIKNNNFQCNIKNDMLKPQYIDKKINLAFFDFMHSKMTNVDKQCIEQFVKNLEQSKGIISLTYCARGSKVDFQVQNVIKYFERLKSKYDTKIQFEYIYPYKRNSRGCVMVFYNIFVGNWSLIETKYNIHHVLCLSKDKKKALVKWFGYPHEFDTWEPVDNILHDLNLKDVDDLLNL